MQKNDKTVLMIIRKGDSGAQEVCCDIRERALARQWNFFSAEVIHTNDGRVCVERSSRQAESVAALVELLRPDGLIVWSDSLSGAEVNEAVGRPLPVVFVGLSPDYRPGVAGATGFVYPDSATIASLAARTLLVSGYGDFAYVPNPADTRWSRERRDAFARNVELAGKRFHAFVRPEAPKGSPDSDLALRRWLDGLPKPCGVFAANDTVGEEVLAACAMLRLFVPDDIAVVGVDNIAYLCESTSPTLSSIDTDLMAESRAAFEILAGLIEHPERSPAVRTVSARGVVQRASTGFARNRRLARAREFIRLHAYEEGFGPRDVVRDMGVSRTLADRIFRSFAGHTILDEIHAVRLGRAKDLLAGGKRPDVVAAECGYSSYDDFRRVFRRRVGTTARQWAKEHGTGNASAPTP